MGYFDKRNVDMSIIKLEPACKDYIWGGDRLIKEYGIKNDGKSCAEAWVLSGHKDGLSRVADGAFRGRTLAEVNADHNILGKNCSKYAEFPVLIKLIDVNKPISIQVHPDDAYALKHEGQYGKTEMWYILSAEEGAFLYLGFEHEVSKDELEERIKNNTLEEILHKEYVKPGDVVFIEPGTLHSIGAGVMVAEIQQSSNVTYRIYDYGRLGADGKPRQLHVEKALDVLKREPAMKYEQKGEHLAECPYFRVDKSDVRDGASYTGNTDESSFASLLIIEGECTISAAGDLVNARKGESYFVEAGTGAYSISGNASVLITAVP